MRTSQRETRLHFCTMYSTEFSKNASLDAAKIVQYLNDNEYLKTPMSCPLT